MGGCPQEDAEPMRIPAFLASVIVLAGCNAGLEDPLHATGSTTILTSSDHAALITTNVEQGTVTRVDTETGVTHEIEVGGEPSRLARAGDSVVVSLRTERALAVLTRDGDTLSLDRTVSTGAEPVGVVADEDGTRVYVAASTSGVVQEFDAQSWELLREFAIEGEPRWLALKPGLDALYVGSAFGGTISTVSLDDGSVTTSQPPRIVGALPSNGGEVDLTPRITGDLAVDPEGKYLAVPVLYVDNSTVGDPASIPGQGYYVQDSGGRFRPSVAILPLGPDGAIHTDEGEAVDLNVFDADGTQWNSYPTSVTIAADKSALLVTMEASDAVVVIDGNDIGRPARSTPSLGGAAPPDNIFGQRINVIVKSAGGPRGAAFLADGSAFVHQFLDGSVASVPLEDARGKFDGQGAAALGTTGTGSIMDAAQLFSGEQLAVSTSPFSAEQAEIELGRRLFYSAEGSSMSQQGAGVSCSTCHFEGRNDGLNWPFQEPLGPRQTPSLAGVVSLTAPVTWTSGVPSVYAEVMATSFDRMGGSPSINDALAVEAYVDWTREVDVPAADDNSAEVLRGKAIFEREDVACADCHSGVAFTDNEAYSMYGEDAVTTRSLLGIAASAPYFHDGSAPDLRSVVLRADDGSMGDTSMLSDAQVDDLVSYLETL